MSSSSPKRILNSKPSVSILIKSILLIFSCIIKSFKQIILVGTLSLTNFLIPKKVVINFFFLNK